MCRIISTTVGNGHEIRITNEDIINIIHNQADK